MLILRASDRSPRDLTGATALMQVKSRTDNATVIAAATIDMSDGASGRIGVTLTAAEGTPLYSYGSPLQTTNLVYDLRITWPSGLVTRAMAGTVILERGVSHG